MVVATKRPELLLSQLLTLHLDLSLKRYRDQPVMSKFLQLADDIESDLRDFDDEADVLNSKRLANKELAREIFNGHHSAQDRVKEGLKKMEAVLHDMGGSNSRKATAQEKGEVVKSDVVEPPNPGEASEEKSEASFQADSGNSGTKVD